MREEGRKRGKAVDDEATVAASDLDLLGFFRTYPASKVVKTSTQTTCMTLQKPCGSACKISIPSFLKEICEFGILHHLHFVAGYGILTLSGATVNTQSKLYHQRKGVTKVNNSSNTGIANMRPLSSELMGMQQDASRVIDLT